MCLNVGEETDTYGGMGQPDPIPGGECTDTSTCEDPYSQSSSWVNKAIDPYQPDLFSKIVCGFLRSLYHVQHLLIEFF